MNQVPSKQHRFGCQYCNKQDSESGGQLQRCAKCKAVLYCSREHQLLHWPEHKTICALQAETFKAISTENPFPAGPEGLSKIEVHKLLNKFPSLYQDPIRRSMVQAMGLLHKTDEEIKAKPDLVYMVDLRLRSDRRPVEAKSAFQVEGTKIYRLVQWLDTFPKFKAAIEAQRETGKNRGALLSLPVIMTCHSHHLMATCAIYIAPGQLLITPISNDCDHGAELKRIVDEGQGSGT